jgi:hypothetical protein
VSDPSSNKKSPLPGSSIRHRRHFTLQPEFGDARIITRPNTLMSWEKLKQAYPVAQIFIYEFDRVTDRLLLGVFDSAARRPPENSPQSAKTMTDISQMTQTGGAN